MTDAEKWAERIRDRWLETLGCSWGEMVEWMIHQGFQLPQEEESIPTPTEMVKRLLEKGWTIEQIEDDDGTVTVFHEPKKGGLGTPVIEVAYNHAFPPKKKVEVEVWLQQCPDNKHKVRETGYFGIAGHDLWTKGIATFYVEDSGEG